MNSLDAIIAFCALMVSFALLLSVVVSQEQILSNSFSAFGAKVSAINCASVVDSLFSNSAVSFSSDFPCGAEGSSVFASKEGKTKLVTIITFASKKFFLEVKTLDHYFN